jgi:hypothetical protein
MSYYSYYSKHLAHKGDRVYVMQPYATTPILTGTVHHHERNGRSEHILVLLDGDNGTTATLPSLCFRSMPRRVVHRDAYGTFSTYIESDPAYRINQIEP